MTRYVCNLPDPLIVRLSEVAETLDLPASEIVRTAIDLHLRFLVGSPVPSATTHLAVAPAPDKLPIPAPAEPRTVFVERSQEPPTLRLREPQPLQRMSVEDKAAMIERIARGGAEKEKAK